MEGLIRWFSRNHVAGNFLMLGVLLAGFYTWFQIRKEIFPETSIDAIAVSVVYPNATPEDVEEGVVIPIEEEIAEVEGIDEIQSTAREGVGVVNIEVANGYDVRDVMDDVKTRVDAIDKFAENAEEPILEELVITSQVLSVAISADADEATLRGLAEDIRDGLLDYQSPTPVLEPVWGSKVLGLPNFAYESALRFLQGEPEITKVQIAGVRDYEISIEVPEETLRRYGLAIRDVATAVRRSSLDIPGGTIKTGAGEVVVRTVAKRYRGEEFEDIVVLTRPDGSAVKLKEIATIVDGFEDQDLSNSFDGKGAVLVNVFRVGDQDTLVLTKAVREYLEAKRRELPQEVTLEIWNDQSVLLLGRLNLLKKNGIVGLALVFLVLAIFLRPSLAFLVALGIPVSFAGGIWLMPETGISINMISLFAFILVLGIVVDDSIVVGENVYRRLRTGEDPKEAAWKGTHEVGVVVIFGVLTTAVAFTPMLGLSGVSGKIWPNIPLIVIPVLLFSLVQSKLVLPGHLALLRPGGHDRKVGAAGRFQRSVANGLERFVEHVYQPFLKRCLRHRWLVAVIFLTMLVVTVFGIVGGKRIKSQFFPEVEADLLVANVQFPRGVPFENVEKVIARIEAEALALGERHSDRDGNAVVTHVLASAGTRPFITAFAPGGPPLASNVGQVTVELRPSAGRDIAAQDLVQEWRERVGAIPGVSELSFVAQAAGGGNAIDINVAGKDLRQLQAATEFLKNKLGEYQGTVDIADSDRDGKRELRIKRLTPMGEALGLRLSDVALQVRNSFYGDEVERLLRGRDELKVMVRYPESERRSVENLEQIKIRTPEGALVPIAQVAEFEEGRGPDTIQRDNRKRSIKITADVDSSKGANANQIRSRFEKEAVTQLPELFPGVLAEFQGEQRDQATSVKEIGIGFLFALIGMYVLMAIPLRSYVQPVIIMSVIPFGIVGAVLGHLLMSTELSIMSMCGIVALAGVVVNDSLVLVDYVNRHRGDSGGIVEAATKAGGRRFRAIMLTSLTTFVGLMPMLLETDMQAKFLIPMAISLGFGILFATLITLILVPSVYVMLEDIKHFVFWLTGRRSIAEPEGEGGALSPAAPSKD